MKIDNCKVYDMTHVKDEISSITQGPRQSNIELLRIVAMFLVLVLHADFLSIGKPTGQDFWENPINAWTRTFIESLSIVCVNSFVLISGWFGIRASLKGFLTLFFQCFFFSFSIYLVLLITGYTSLSLQGILNAVSLMPTSWWFIPAYIGLYILSPILNSFLRKENLTYIFWIVVAFYTFQTLWGWSGVALFVENGFSTISFIGLYILANYIRLLNINNLKYGGVIYILSITAISVIYWFQQSFYQFNLYIYAYVNPLVILASVGILMFFVSLHIKPNKVINWIARSSFAVYLLHTNYYIFNNIFKIQCNLIYSTYSGLTCILIIFTFLSVIFGLSILLDQPRIWLWSLVKDRIFKIGHNWAR